MIGLVVSVERALIMQLIVDEVKQEVIKEIRIARFELPQGTGKENERKFKMLMDLFTRLRSGRFPLMAFSLLTHLCSV